MEEKPTNTEDGTSLSSPPPAEPKTADELALATYRIVRALARQRDIDANEIKRLGGVTANLVERVSTLESLERQAGVTFDARKPAEPSPASPEAAHRAPSKSITSEVRDVRESIKVVATENAEQTSLLKTMVTNQSENAKLARKTLAGFVAMVIFFLYQQCAQPTQPQVQRYGVPFPAPAAPVLPVPAPPPR